MASPSVNLDGEPSSPTPNIDGFTPSKLPRSAYSQVLAQEENFQKASEVRSESEQRKEELRKQRERFRQRGLMLKAQREKSRQQLQKTIQGCNDSNQALGNATRTQREALKKERDARQQKWEEHGRSLHEQHEALRDRLKASAEENRAARTKEAEELKEALKRVGQRAEDTILKQKTASAAKVRAATDKEFIRASKQSFIDDRWNSADELRASLTRLRERQARQKAEYIESAHVLKAQQQQKADDVANANFEAAKARAKEIRIYEKALKAEAKAAALAETERKRSLHVAMEEAKLVPESEIAKSDDPEAGPMQMFTRFFGFRKRGGGHHLSSVAGVR